MSRAVIRATIDIVPILDARSPAQTWPDLEGQLVSGS